MAITSAGETGTAQPSEAAAVEILMNRGLRNMWYPVAPGWMIGPAPVGLTRLSENIVLWRDSAGKVHALEDRCPHRGARLTLGWSLGDRLACWYHGVEVRGDGVVPRVPAQANAPMEGKRCVRSYHVEERAGTIFVWFGDSLHADPAELQLPDELVSPEYEAILCTAHWKCNYRYAIDNVMDPMHGAYLHAQSHSMAEGDKHAEMRLRKTDTGFVFEKANQRGVNFDWTEFGITNALWLRLEIPYGKQAGPGGAFTIVGMVVPVDEEHCRVFFWRIRKISGWQKDTWKFMYRARLEKLHWDVLEQDRVVLEDMAPQAREHEFLYQHDAGLGRVRTTLLKAARDQVKALAAAKSAAGEAPRAAGVA
ncbi:aromatic ring-hydroxylating dioxygenase subunit alpha [Ferrovibrio sp.]|uniref:aromatic ring-hydroxylating dioxygenase subunit alpha n=1 Tax=Ferrovibrio sp. TaxID=1917215 RepID=UPI00311FCB1D